MTGDLWTERVVAKDYGSRTATAVLRRAPPKEDLMKIFIFLLVVVAIPVGLIIWQRRGNDGVVGHDPHAHKDIGSGGPPNQTRDLGSGGPL